MTTVNPHSSSALFFFYIFGCLNNYSNLEEESGDHDKADAQRFGETGLNLNLSWKKVFFFA